MWGEQNNIFVGSKKMPLRVGERCCCSGATRRGVMFDGVGERRFCSHSPRRCGFGFVFLQQVDGTAYEFAQLCSFEQPVAKKGKVDKLFDERLGCRIFVYLFVHVVA